MTALLILSFAVLAIAAGLAYDAWLWKREAERVLLLAEQARIEAKHAANVAARWGR